ncbi:DNA mismatch repair protein MutS [Dyadobacter luteus]|uniref:DNA mismatch repair protein MutS n=1 Tax=Dyadobacter luteus TaxID=2259619 RepID=A0A3D8YAS5_9BACT|nr:DNA mismatch repair protein MutS [Dyadobacter luteus]REA60910.1 DNA mismatch repair protein MutS [Dyadobacter luteus]
MLKSKNKFLHQLRAQAGKLKKDYFDFRKIENFFLLNNNNGNHQIISDKTCQDLDLDEVFMFLDRTTSAVGQQVLYKTLRTIPKNKTRTDRFERIIRIFEQNPAIVDILLPELALLSKKEAYHISSLFLGKHIQKPGWFLIIPLLSLLALLSVILSFFHPQFIILLLVLLSVNFSFHYWNKVNIYQYSSSLPELLRLNRVAKNILSTEALNDAEKDVQASVRKMDALGSRMFIFKLEEKLQSEAGQLVEYLLELLKALLLIEPLMLFHILKQIDLIRDDIRQIFEYVGNIDVAMSIYFLRKDLDYFCKPTISADAKHIKASSVYHPLIFKSVPNTMESQSALLTGSNMSGKTTFIRTIGINTITAQTINTCFAQEFTIPILRVHSAIRITDDLLSEKSYYFEEVLTIRDLLKESTSGHANLFLLDEMFKGTNTVERIASAKAVLTYLNKGPNITIAATHDLELAELLKDEFSVYHFTEILEGGKITFDYRIKPGVLRETNAIRILALNNYPAEVVTEATLLADSILKNKI